MLLVDLLRNQIDAERICEDRLRLIATSPHLTEDDRAGVLEQAEEEVEHRRLFTACLRQYSPATMEAGLAPDGPWAIAEARKDTPEDPACWLANFRATERLMRPALAGMQAEFRAAGDTVTVQTIDRVQADEAAHVAFNRALFTRMQAHPVVGSAIQARYRRIIQTKAYGGDLYRLARERA